MTSVNKDENIVTMIATTLRANTNHDDWDEETWIISFISFKFQIHCFFGHKKDTGTDDINAYFHLDSR